MKKKKKKKSYLLEWKKRIFLVKDSLHCKVVKLYRRLFQFSQGNKIYRYWLIPVYHFGNTQYIYIYMYVFIYLLIFMFINIEFKIHIFYKSKYQPKYIYQYISLNNIFLYKKIQKFFFFNFCIVSVETPILDEISEICHVKSSTTQYFFSPNKFQRITSMKYFASTTSTYAVLTSLIHYPLRNKN